MKIDIQHFFDVLLYATIVNNVFTFIEIGNFKEDISIWQIGLANY